jgi:hypothetical protein
MQGREKRWDLEKGKREGHVIDVAKNELTLYDLKYALQYMMHVS